MNLINESSQAHKVIVEQSRKLAGKWEKSGLLEGLGGTDKQSMAVMLENQASQLLSEASVTNAAGTSGEQWAGVAPHSSVRFSAQSQVRTSYQSNQ